ncbi:hypothetical protein KWH04_16050 [Xanthomonas campestris pv. trichodesmae]|uniref:hypothetical protein n=1 Tax=Xanthomonas citri TaxID=346 RepID=UPI0012FD8EDC|nr:hypothetical protein [Xanthomonas citri]MBV6782124.1 hypothetical protein [Xanthomonas campestris pv. trichodesmae]
MNDKLHIGGVDDDDQRCLRCGYPTLDTGWECTECGYDNMPHYVGADQQSKPEVQ